MNPDYIVILLGNPGSEYSTTRHNAGRIVGEFVVGSIGAVLSPLQERVGVRSFTHQKHLRSSVVTEQFGGKNFLFVSPDIYMNESGMMVPLLQKAYPGVRVENYIVMYDDLDILLGDMKLSFDRGAGGHNGIKSLIQHTGTKRFIRMRIGISRKAPSTRGGGDVGAGGVSVADSIHEKERIIKPDVLGNFHQSEIDCLKTLTHKITKILNSLGEVGFEMTQSRVGVLDR
jgi:peptidyl-tRNA hydrolase, PTH1 family